MAILDPTSLTSSNWNTPLFLQDVVSHLVDRLQTVGYVNRQIEQARAEWNAGDTIKLRKTGTFTVSSEPYANMAAVPQIVPGNDEFKVDQYRNTGMRMTDIEEAITGENAWQMHAQRLAYAMGVEVETAVSRLFIRSPHTIQAALSAVNEDILIDCNRIFQELGIPEDGPAFRRFVGDPNIWKKFVKVAMFNQQQGAGQDGVTLQNTGEFGTKFGIIPYTSNQLTIQPTAANLPTGGTETAAAATGADIISGVKGSTTVTLTYTGLASPTVFTEGQVIQLGIGAGAAGLLAPTAGKAYRHTLYTVKSSAAVSGGNIVVTLSQPLRQTHTGQWRRIIMAAADAPHMMAGAYYRDAIALAMVALPDNKPGVNMFTVTNRDSGISMRATEVYDPFRREMAVLFDMWFGLHVIDPDKLIRVAINLNA